jgi:hypothetical protein
MTTDRENYHAVRAYDREKITMKQRRSGFADALAELFVGGALSLTIRRIVTRVTPNRQLREAFFKHLIDG